MKGSTSGTLFVPALDSLDCESNDESTTKEEEIKEPEEKRQKETQEEPKPEEKHKEKEKEPKPEEKKEPEMVRCRHILVKHRNSRNPSSWRELKITRSREHALERIKKLRSWIEEGKATFEQVAKHESDCSSAKHGGDLGFFPRGKMQKAFEDVAFSLLVGEMSDVVETASGYHIILRVQ